MRPRTAPACSASTTRPRCRPATTGASLMTKDWNPLEPKVLEYKLYARGVGLVLAMHVSGGSDREELVRYQPGGRPRSASSSSKRASGSSSSLSEQLAQPGEPVARRLRVHVERAGHRGRVAALPHVGQRGLLHALARLRRELAQRRQPAGSDALDQRAVLEQEQLAERVVGHAPRGPRARSPPPRLRAAWRGRTTTTRTARGADRPGRARRGRAGPGRPPARGRSAPPGRGLPGPATRRSPPRRPRRPGHQAAGALPAGRDPPRPRPAPPPFGEAASRRPRPRRARRPPRPAGRAATAPRGLAGAGGARPRPASAPRRSPPPSRPRSPRCRRRSTRPAG